MKKNFGAFGARQFSLETLVGGRPSTTIFQNPGGGGAGGGVAYKDRAWPPPLVSLWRDRQLPPITRPPGGHKAVLEQTRKRRFGRPSGPPARPSVDSPGTALHGTGEALD